MKFSSLIGSVGFVAGLILLIGIANDEATIPQILIVLLIAGILFAISFGMAFYEHSKDVVWYHLEFQDYNGYIRKVRAYTYAGRCKAIHDYTKLGYLFYAEGVVTKEMLEREVNR